MASPRGKNFGPLTDDEQKMLLAALAALRDA
jgi:hypothetical protein